MNETTTALYRALQQERLSVTTARLVVFQALQDSEPQTMLELITRCKDIVDRASVYRSITLFERLGIVQRLHIGWKYRLELSNAFQHHHHHLTCLRCGTITDLPEDALLEEQLVRLAKRHDFDAQDHQLEIRGLCAPCGT